MIRLLRAGLMPALALVACLVAWQLTRLPDTSDTVRRAPERFAFQRTAINEPGPGRGLREVAPAYEKIRSWISSVGAAVALFDAEGKGRADDICLVDPRTDAVTVRPAPGGAGGYAPFALSHTGITYTAAMAPMGCMPADLDEDGRQDLLVYYWGRSPVSYIRTGGMDAAGFTPRELVSPYQVWNTDAVALADVDGDGHGDLVVGNYFADGAQVLDTTSKASLHMQDSMSNAVNGGSTRVLLHSGGGAFTEAPDAIPGDLGHGWTLALGAQDLNGDGLPEIYIGNDFGPDRLLVNSSTPGKVRLAEATGPRGPLTPKSKVLGNDSFKGMGVAFTDFNGDGVPDMAVSNITEPYALEESNFAWVSTGEPFSPGYAPYQDDSERLGTSRGGWAWDVKAADFDADGTDEIVQAMGFVRGEVNRWPELQELAMANDTLLHLPGLWFQAAPGDDISGHDYDVMFAKGADGRYADVAQAVGLGDDAVTRGLAVGDVNGDGRLDLALANQWDQSQFFLNTSKAPANHLSLRLSVPAGANACGSGTGAATATRPALGAAVTVKTGGGDRHAQLYYTNGHGGVSAPDLYFGLGQAASGPLPVTVKWIDPCGAAHTATADLAPGQHALLLTNAGAIKEG
ncbi:CRTAC1 family protein [Sphaerisporangium sp. NBC_01403]|uniref:CRTAC1 family protein n=1 Tax=Sphaerisporangium sp. NBC_01403 TaxID=2903599 RepID=UPI00325378DE